MAAKGGAGTPEALVHALFAVSIAAFAIPYFSASLMELLRPVGPSLSALLMDVPDYLSDRNFVFLFCSVLLFLVAGESSLVASSGPDDAGFMAEIISKGGHVWQAPRSLDAEPDDVGGGVELPGVGPLLETVAVEGEGRAQNDVDVDAEGEEDEEGDREAEEEDAQKQEEQEDEAEEEVDGGEFRRKCDDFIEKVKRERIMEALHLVLV